jgi:hypothetical protein
MRKKQPNARKRVDSVKITATVPPDRAESGTAPCCNGNSTDTIAGGSGTPTGGRYSSRYRPTDVLRRDAWPELLVVAGETGRLESLAETLGCIARWRELWD